MIAETRSGRYMPVATSKSVFSTVLSRQPKVSYLHFSVRILEPEQAVRLGHRSCTETELPLG